MKTMSGETEPRVCEEDFGSDEGDVESYLEEEDNSSELTDRLRELEAENSALILANENQREAYERCLDEVANHVVQALLNQKDLREECIKLKMLVFDLERQNRALCELFQHKLPNQSSTQYQVQPGPLPEYNTQLHNDSAKQVETALTEAQAKHGSPGPWGPAASMEALSPFFKKKAHILEVLRKMEETDPLKFHPSSAGLSFCDYSQALMSGEAVLAAGDLPLPCSSHHTHCRCSCSESHVHPHLNGDVAAVKSEGCHTCSVHCKKSTDSPAKCNHVCSPPNLSSAQNYIISTAALSECHMNSTALESGLPVKQPTAKDHQQPGGPNSYLSITSTDQNSSAYQSSDDCQVLTGSKVTKTGDAQDAEMDGPKGGRSDEGSSLYTTSTQIPVRGEKSTPQMSYCEMATRELPHSDLLPSDGDSSAWTPEKDSSGQEAYCGRADAPISPNPSCLSEAKTAAISSPSKLLKFLKIPSIGERSQSSSPVRLSPVRLSPQLTRTSRIPCRTNNYEVYHSPVPSRRATTTERCRQPHPPPARSESYPATHSAPTSPPQPEQLCPLLAKELSYSSTSRGAKLGPAPSSSSSSGVSQTVPHYENVTDLSIASQQGGQSRSTLPNHSKASGGERKLVKSLPEGSVISQPHAHSSSSSSSSSDSSSSSEQDVGVESTAWHSHHSLPNSCALHRAQGNGGANVRSTRDRAPDTEARETSLVNADPPQAPLPSKRNDPSSIPKRPGPVRPPAESSHHAFKDRLAALGKLRSSEDLRVSLQPVDTPDTMQSSETAVSCGDERSRTAERPVDNRIEEQSHCIFTDSLDGRSKSNVAGSGLKLPSTCQLYEQGAKPLLSGPMRTKSELETLYSRVAVAQTDSPKSKLGLLSPITDTPQVLRNNMKCPGSLNLSYNGKPGPGTHNSSPSPSKVPPKSPSKPHQALSVRVGRSTDVPRYSSKSEERSKIGGNKKKNPAYGDSLPPPPPRPPTESPEEKASLVLLQSAMEQKVMKGIEENMLKVQEQDKGGQAVEVKQKTSNGIASWFGLKKSKLPALSRKADGPKAKEEKREWKINIPSVGKDSKMAARCKEGVEGLNISTLMEKAEGLRRALEEERTYVDRSGRGHSCEVVMDQVQGQLAVMYRGGGRSDNFMQQLLNRVDGKDVVPSVPQRRLSFDCKMSRAVFSQQGDSVSREAVEKGSDLISNVTSDENLAGSVHSQHFAAGSGASTYTLDSGIGTFPLPDYSSGLAGRSLSKSRSGADSQASGSPGRAGRRSRTLDRDMSSLEECYPAAHKQLISTIQHGSGLEEKSPSLMQTAGVIHEDKEAYGAHMSTPHSKTWAFPSLKTPAGPTEVYLAVEEEDEEEPATYGSPFRGSVKPRAPSSSRPTVDPGSLAVPVQTGLSRPGKTRTPSIPEMSREAGLELLRERPEEALSPSRPLVLETPESLSDSLYDSLSSCGSQG